MSYRLVMVDPPALVRFVPGDRQYKMGQRQGRRLEVGNCWECTQGREGEWWGYPDGHFRWPVTLTPHYLSHHARRRKPLMVFLPGELVLCVDDFRADVGHDGTSGYTTHGDSANLTINEMVDYGTRWRGHIQNGWVVNEPSWRPRELWAA